MWLDMLRIQDRFCYSFFPVDRIYFSLNKGSQIKINQENRHLSLNSLLSASHLCGPSAPAGTVTSSGSALLSSPGTLSQVHLSLQRMLLDFTSLDKNLFLVFRPIDSKLLDFSLLQMAQSELIFSLRPISVLPSHTRIVLFTYLLILEAQKLSLILHSPINFHNLSTILSCQDHLLNFLQNCLLLSICTVTISYNQHISPDLLYGSSMVSLHPFLSSPPINYLHY